jgi:hypothetical protein
LYITEIYYVTTTMTTVGYGDISPMGNESVDALLVEEIFCMFMIFFGIAVFGLVQNRVSGIKTQESPD